jgi:hypothetical protein
MQTRFMIDKRTHTDDKGDNKITQPDPETLHTTDPQENMEGPVSSLMHDTGGAFDSDKTAKEADEERDRNL